MPISKEKMRLRKEADRSYVNPKEFGNTYFRPEITEEMVDSVTPAMKASLQAALAEPDYMDRIRMRSDVRESLGLALKPSPQDVCDQVNAKLGSSEVNLFGGSQMKGAIYDTVKRYGGSI